ncbi:MAG TPA: phosphatase PAP2 family protein [Longimicrobium sp.]|nr:phosphatase PAP2 family protein [Longimicrobium sp.]
MRDDASARRVRGMSGVGGGRERGRSRIGWLRRRAHGFYSVAGVLLTVGFLLSLLGLWALSGLTDGVMDGETLRFDEGVLLWMDARSSSRLDVLALKVTALGDTLVVITIALVAGTLLWLLKQRAHAALLAAAVGGVMLIHPLLKWIFDRPRPQLFEWRTHYAASSSYPSGHAALSMVLLAVLAYIVHRLADRRWIGVAAMLLAGIAVLLVGLSRLYLGVHYPSDVVAGYTVGFAWAVFCALALEALRHRRRSRRDAERRIDGPGDVVEEIDPEGARRASGTGGG